MLFIIRLQSIGKAKFVQYLRHLFLIIILFFGFSSFVNYLIPQSMEVSKISWSNIALKKVPVNRQRLVYPCGSIFGLIVHNFYGFITLKL